jgi:ketosteroid isomerase-like protein
MLDRKALPWTPNGGHSISNRLTSREERKMSRRFVLITIASFMLVAGVIAAPSLGAHAQDATSTNDIEANKALVQRYYDEVWSGGDTNVALEVLAPDFKWWFGIDELFKEGPEATKAHAETLRAQIEGMGYTLDKILAEDDLVAVRWILTSTTAGANGTPAATTVFCTGNNIIRIEDGLIAELWTETASCI